MASGSGRVRGLPRAKPSCGDCLVCSMSLHWSGVGIGEYFDLTITFDSELYCVDHVDIPMQRREPDGLSTCMLEAVPYIVKSQASDSAYHIRKALVCQKVTPALKSAPKKRKAMGDSHMTSFFAVLPKLPTTPPGRGKPNIPLAYQVHMEPSQYLINSN